MSSAVLFRSNSTIWTFCVQRHQRIRLKCLCCIESHNRNASDSRLILFKRNPSNKLTGQMIALNLWRIKKKNIQIKREKSYVLFFHTNEPHFAADMSMFKTMNMIFGLHAMCQNAISIIYIDIYRLKLLFLMVAWVQLKHWNDEFNFV